MIFVYVFHLWNYNLNVPFTYSGDVVGVLQRINVFVRGESLSNVQSLGAPYGVNLYHSLFEAYFPQLFMYVFAKITNSAGLSLNLYYILTYVLSAMCTYFLLRKMEVSEITSMTCGIIYAFIPGHMLRNEGHLFIGSTFVLPLMVLSIMYLAEGQLCKMEYQGKDRLNVKEVFLSIDRKMIFCVLCFVLTTFSSLYYGIFALFLLTFAAVYVAVDKKQWRHFLYYFILCVTELICVILIYFPIILSAKLDKEFHPVEIITRVIGDVETYGLKLIQLLLPIKGHRLSFFASITEEYSTSFPLVTENQVSCLGMIMAAGFLISLIIVFFNLTHNKGDKELIFCGKINLFIICLAGIGGGASIIAFINYNIRCYNRFSFYIGLFSIITIGKIFDVLWKIFEQKEHNEKRLLMSRVLTAMIIVCIAIFDQTTESMAYSKSSAAEVEKIYNNDKNFVREIENHEEENSSILVLPTEPGISTEYGEIFLQVHSEISNWSVGSYPGDQSSRFLDNLKRMSPDGILKIACAMGYSGVAIYYPGYGEENLQKYKEVLDSNLGQVLFENKNGTWGYYSLKHYRKKMEEKFTKDEWEKLEEICYDNNFTFSSVLGKNLYCTDKDTIIDKNTMIIPPGGIQYGPYTILSEGNYKVLIKGENLKNVDFICTSDKGQSNIKMYNLQKNKAFVSYEIYLDKNTDDVEFICSNTSKKNIKVEKIEYTKINYLNGAISASSLYNTDKENRNSDDGMMIVTPESIQYGPYINMIQGNYKIEITGKNLKNAEFRCTSDNGQKEIKISELTMTDDSVTYEICLEQSTDAVEFVCENSKDADIAIEQIKFYKKTNRGYEVNYDYNDLIRKLLE